MFMFMYWVLPSQNEIESQLLIAKKNKKRENALE